MEIAFLFYEGMTALDAVGLYEVLSRLPESTVCRVAKSPGEIATDSELKLIAEHSLESVSHADILIILGVGSATTLQYELEVHD